MRSEAKPNQPRKHIRHEIVGRVFIHNEEHLYIAPLNNISLGGVFVDKVVTIEVGQIVRVIIKSPALGEPIQAIGKVVRVETNTRMGTAVEFDWVGPRFKEILLSQQSALQAA
jgi:hypothetical protein